MKEIREQIIAVLDNTVLNGHVHTYMYYVFQNKNGFGNTSKPM